MPGGEEVHNSSNCVCEVLSKIAEVIKLDRFSLFCTFLHSVCIVLSIPVSVTRFGDLLDFGQVFKPFGNNSIAQISHILWQFL